MSRLRKDQGLRELVQERVQSVNVVLDTLVEDAPVRHCAAGVGRFDCSSMLISLAGRTSQRPGALVRNFVGLAEDANLTQEQLSFAARIDRSYISQLENDRKSPTVDLLFRICNALGISASGLLAHVEARESRRRRRIDSPTDWALTRACVMRLYLTLQKKGRTRPSVIVK